MVITQTASNRVRTRVCGIEIFIVRGRVNARIYREPVVRTGHIAMSTHHRLTLSSLDRLTRVGRRASARMS